MAIIKKDELRSMDKASLQKKLDEITVEINLNLGAIKTSGKPSNNKFRELRKLRSSILARLAAVEKAKP